MATEEIDRILIKQMETGRTPSIQYIIFSKDSVIHRFQSGLADINNNKIITERTTFNAYSVTKTFTSLAVMQLAGQKKLDIDQPFKKYLPGFPYSPEITIKQVLTHSAGIPNPIPLSWIHLASEHQSFNGNDFFGKIFIRQGRLKSKPGAKFAYSNLGYVLLGQLIEEVSGLSYEDYIRENILKVLDIKPDELDFKINDISLHAKGYHRRYSISNAFLGLLIDRSKYMATAEGRWISINNCYVNGASYGGLIGTADAFMKYLMELLKPDCRLISDDFKKMIFTENFTNNNNGSGMCLSWFTGKLNGEQYFAHAGGGFGYYCEIRIYPYAGIGSVIMFNRTGMTDERYLDKPDKYIISR